MDPMISATELRHLRPVKALEFPASDPEWEMGQSFTHVRLCELLYHVIRCALSDAHTVGGDQFVYFHATDPTRKCAPDAFVKLNVPPAPFDSWKVWERGTPELCVEIISPSDAQEKPAWEDKMERYAALGVRELFAFDEAATPGSRLRAWDHIRGDLVPRVVEGEATPCLALGLHWVVVPTRAPSGEELPAALRLARDPEGKDLVPTRAESADARAESADARAESADARAESADARAEAAEARAVAAEAELARLRKTIFPR
jgi:hypothetical protein